MMSGLLRKFLWIKPRALAKTETFDLTIESTEKKEQIMADKFVTALDKVGDALKWFFTNKTAVEIESGGLQIAEIAFPAVAPLLSAVQKSIATAQGLAANVPAGLNTTQMTALVMSDAQAAFAEYQTATGSKIETTQQQSIISLMISLLQNLPGSTTVTAPVTASASSTAPVASAVPAASASAGTLL